jgi:hypothetical protein
MKSVIVLLCCRIYDLIRVAGMFYLPGSALDGCQGSTGPNSEADTICFQIVEIIAGTYCKLIWWGKTLTHLEI